MFFGRTKTKIFKLGRTKTKFFDFTVERKPKFLKLGRTKTKVFEIRSNEVISHRINITF